ncbi:MAG: MarR family winged helix-turn-helix transcriptional regulator [Ilumatobacter sp.]
MSPDALNAEELTDHVDEIVDQWTRERPDLDVSGMAIIGRLGRLERAIRARLDVVFAMHDLEAWEFDVLATLRRHGEPHRLTPGELLESMMVTSGAMTNRIDRLEGRGFVRRSKSPTDGRQVLVQLTPAGFDKVEAAVADHAANELTLIDVLDPGQRDQLIELLRLLHHGVVVASADS